MTKVPVGMSYDRFKRTYHSIPHIQRTRPNGRVFFEREDLDAWLRIGKRRPKS